MNTPVSRSGTQIYHDFRKFEKSRRIYSEVVRKSSDSILKKIIQRISVGTDGILTDIDVIHSDYEYEKYIRTHGTHGTDLNKNLTALNKNLTKRSALLLEDRWTIFGGNHQIIKGLINDKKICLGFFAPNFEEPFNKYYSGTIDGQEITSEDAERIFIKYYDIAKERTDRIESIRSKNVKTGISNKTRGAVYNILVFK